MLSPNGSIAKIEAMQCHKIRVGFREGRSKGALVPGPHQTGPPSSTTNNLCSCAVLHKIKIFF